MPRQRWVLEPGHTAADIWSGDSYRSEHLRAADFFDVEALQTSG